MFQVRIHGRGGQGVVTAAELLSEAAFAEGHHAQAFPSYGSERTGAPVLAFCRIADSAIRVREPVMASDALIIQDETLLGQVDVFAGVRGDGYVLINSTRTFTELGLDDLASDRAPGRLITVPATDLALEHLGRPVPNAVLLGAFAAQAGAITVESVCNAIRGRFPGKVAEKNCVAAAAAYSFVKSQLKEPVGA